MARLQYKKGVYEDDRLMLRFKNVDLDSVKDKVFTDENGVKGKFYIENKLINGHGICGYFKVIKFNTKEYGSRDIKNNELFKML